MMVTVVVITKRAWGALNEYEKREIMTRDLKNRMTRSKLALGAATIALAAAFTIAPSVVPGDMDGAAYAKGNDNGKGGGKDNGKGGGKDNGKGGGKSADKGKSSKSAASKKPAPKPMKVAPGQAKKVVLASTSADAELTELHPSQKGKWNASNANQAALDAHIRNGNFNGTIGALSQYQLAAKAAAGEELNEAEMAALDNFVTVEDLTFADEDLAAVLNGDGTATDLPMFEVTDGVATCVANCDADGFDPATIDADANKALSDYQLAEQQAAVEAAYDDFFTASEQRIIDESNKSLSDDLNEVLLDGIAADLGVMRPEEVIPGEGEELGEVIDGTPAEEELVLVVE